MSLGPGGRETCTVLQAAQRVGVARRTIYNWMRRGIIETTRTASGAPRVFVDTLYNPAAGKRRGGPCLSTSSAETPSNS